MTALARGAPMLHWTMVDIPAAVTALDSGMCAPVAGAHDGPNIRGPNHAYMGPHTPPGPKHRYHVQIFALDRTIDADAVPTYDALASAMLGQRAGERGSDRARPRTVGAGTGVRLVSASGAFLARILRAHIPIPSPGTAEHARRLRR